MPFCVHCREAHHSSVWCPHAPQAERAMQHDEALRARRGQRRASGWRARRDENRVMVENAKGHENVYSAMEDVFRKAREGMVDHPIEAYLFLRQTRRLASGASSRLLTPDQRQRFVSFVDRVDRAIKFAEDGDPDIAHVFAPWVAAVVRRYELELAVTAACGRLAAHRAKSGRANEAPPNTEEETTLAAEMTHRRLAQLDASAPPDPSLKDLQLASGRGGRVLLAAATMAPASAIAFYLLWMPVAAGASVMLGVVLGVAWVTVLLRAQNARERLDVAASARRAWEGRTQAQADESAMLRRLASACRARDADHDEHGPQIATWESTHPEFRGLVLEACIVGLGDDGRE